MADSAIMKMVLSLYSIKYGVQMRIFILRIVIYKKIAHSKWRMARHFELCLVSCLLDIRKEEAESHKYTGPIT